MKKILDQYGIPRQIAHINAVERLSRLKQDNGSNPWPVIEECFKIWESTNPSKYNSYLVYLDNIRKTRKDKKFASTYDKKHGGYLRYTLDIPQKVMAMIRTIYSPEELVMSEDFFAEFARRFPKLMIPEKI